MKNKSQSYSLALKDGPPITLAKMNVRKRDTAYKITNKPIIEITIQVVDGDCGAEYLGGDDTGTLSGSGELENVKSLWLQEKHFSGDKLLAISNKTGPSAKMKTRITPSIIRTVLQSRPSRPPKLKSDGMLLPLRISTKGHKNELIIKNDHIENEKRFLSVQYNGVENGSNLNANLNKASTITKKTRRIFMLHSNRPGNLVTRLHFLHSIICIDTLQFRPTIRINVARCKGQTLSTHTTQSTTYLGYGKAFPEK